MTFDPPSSHLTCNLLPAGTISATVCRYFSYTLPSSKGLTTVLYIDQPIGTGFSFGTVNVNSTFAAAPPIWQAFQVLFESPEFHKFQSRE